MLFVGIMHVSAASIDSCTVPVRMALITTGLILSVSVWLLPWTEWFPGSAVYRGDASFIVRHAVLISFIGFLATLFTCFQGVVRIVRGLLKGPTRTETAPTSTEGE